MECRRALIQCLKRMSPAHCYATSMSPPAVEQVIAAMHVLRGKDGSDRGIRKIQKLHDNANYFRHRLSDMGCSVLGSDDSPVMVSVACLHLHLVVLPSHIHVRCIVASPTLYQLPHNIIVCSLAAQLDFCSSIASAACLLCFSRLHLHEGCFYASQPVYVSLCARVSSQRRNA